MNNKNEIALDNAIDILQNDIADYVIGEYCTTKKCEDFDNCKDDCIYEQAIDKVIKELTNSISKEEIKNKIAEIETNPNFGGQYWYDEDVVNLLFELIEEE